MATMTYSDTLQILDCGVCHITFALPDNLYRRVRRTGDWFWCPNGHQIHYFETENAKLKAQLDQAEANAREHRRLAELRQAEAEHQAAKARGYKGALVQAKKRSAKGVCPVAGCKRHFVDVQRHVASKHPDYTGEVAG